MTPDQPERQSGPSKRHRRSRSVNMTRQEVIDLTDLKDNDTGSSRKHDLNDKDAQIDGQSKRAKLKRDSEPPMRKDKSMTPKPKPKELKKDINNRKASRTSDHKKLKERAETLERDLVNEQRAHHKTKQEFKDAVQDLKKSTKNVECELMSVRQAHDDTQQDFKESVETLEDELKNSREAHDDKKKELEVTKQDLKDKEQSLTSTLAELKAVQNICDAKSEQIRKQQVTIETDGQELQRLKAVVDDPSHGLLAIQKSCQEKDEVLKAKDDHIAAVQKEIADGKAQISRLEQALAETKLALKTAKSNFTDCRNELVKREEKLRSTEQDRDEAKEAREKAETAADALHCVNEENGHRIHNSRLREQKAKDSLKLVKAEKAKLDTLCTKLRAQESERNQMVASLQQKLKASNHQSQRYNYKEPDEKIKKDFAALESKIRQFVNKIARPVLNATDHELNTVWPNWSAELRYFLTSPLLCNLIFEAYVWECLIARIFAPEAEIWAGDLGRSLEKTLYLAADETAQVGYKNDLYIDFQYLRSSSSSLIRQLNGEDFRPKYFDKDIELMISNLAKLCGCALDGAMKPDVVGIFKDARDFEIQLRMLKAVYTFRMCNILPNRQKLKHGFDFSDEHMDDRSPKLNAKNPQQALSVDFIMCPGLYKRGNNSGANYETQICLIKMGVICNAKELCLKPGSSTLSRSNSKQSKKAPRSSEVKQENDGNVPSPTSRRSKSGLSFSNTVDIDTASRPTLTIGSPAMKQHDAAPSVKTRSQTSPKADRNAPGGKSSSKVMANDHPPMRAARGRGGGNSGKRTKTSRGPGPDDEFDPQIGAFV